jgi:hypothetical protein
MRFHRVAYPAFASGLFVVISIISSFAQSRCDTIRPARSAGLVLSITKTLLQRNHIIINFAVTNKLGARVYVKDALVDQSQTAFLGSGPHISFPQNVASIRTCTDVNTCLATSQDLNAFSYIEPGDTLAFSLDYSPNSPVPPDDSISFSVALVARFTTPNGDVNKAGAAAPVRFNFSNIPIGC